MKRVAGPVGLVLALAGLPASAQPTAAEEVAYDRRLLEAVAAADSFRGPLDGGWTLSVGGEARYAFELADKDGRIEGAWRDLRRPGALDASGLVDTAAHHHAHLTLRFDGKVATLRPTKNGWAGELTGASKREQVSLARR